MINNISKKLILYIAILCFIYSIIVFAFFIVPFFDKNLLLKLFDTYHVYDNLPFIIPREDVQKIVYELMDFLMGKKYLLDTKVHMDGVLVDFYSPTVKIHMGDCRNLFQAHGYLAKIMFIPTIFGITYTIMTDAKWYDTIFKAYKNILITITILLASIITFALINFDLFFICFHKIFFRNDLWLFDPSKDYIINYLPEQLFANIGIRITIFVVVLLSLVFLLLYLLKRTLSRPSSK